MVVQLARMLLQQEFNVKLVQQIMPLMALGVVKVLAQIISFIIQVLVLA